MKKFIYLLMFSFAMLLAMPPSESKAMSKHEHGTCFVIDQSQTAPAALVQEQETGGVAVQQANDNPVDANGSGVADWFKENWFALSLAFLGFLEAIARLTPTEKDNSVVSWIGTLFNVLVPNKKKGGGTFSVPSK